MKAVVFHAHGPLENIHIEDIPEPRPARGECLVRVKAVSLNGFDPMILRGIPGLRTPIPMTPGADVSGEIVEIGAEVDRARWKVGDRVAVIPNRKPGMMGETLRGGACELITVEPEWLLPVPDKVTHVRRPASLPPMARRSV
jgi:alcohol dehydrogenase